MQWALAIVRGVLSNSDANLLIFEKKKLVNCPIDNSQSHNSTAVLTTMTTKTLIQYSNYKYSSKKKPRITIQTQSPTSISIQHSWGTQSSAVQSRIVRKQRFYWLLVAIRKFHAALVYSTISSLFRFYFYFFFALIVAVVVVLTCSKLLITHD